MKSVGGGEEGEESEQLSVQIKLGTFLGEIPS